MNHQLRIVALAAVTLLLLPALAAGIGAQDVAERVAGAGHAASTAADGVTEESFYCPECEICKRAPFGGQWCWWAGMGVVGRCNCTDTATYCSLYGGFCEEIVVIP